MPAADLAEEIARLAQKADVKVGVAESLTSGNAASAFGRAPEAASWFAGSVVAYSEAVKFDVLGVRPGPVVTAECAREMAQGACAVLGADVAVSATGVGGPDPAEGKPAGTVFVACAERDGGVTDRRLEVDGSPEEVIEASVAAMLELAHQALTARVDGPERPGA